MNLYTYHGIYRAHATNTGNHLPNNLYDTYYNYNPFFASLVAKPQWDVQPQYLANVFHYSGAELLLTQGTATNTYTRDPIYDCPPPNADGYRYVAYSQLHIRRPANNASNFKGFLLTTAISETRILPEPELPPTPETPDTQLTTNDALFLYYTYQYHDILRTNERLRNTLSRPLLPTDANIVAKMEQALQNRSGDGCGIYDTTSCSR